MPAPEEFPKGSAQASGTCDAWLFSRQACLPTEPLVNSIRSPNSTEGRGELSTAKWNRSWRLTVPEVFFTEIFSEI